MPQDRLVLPHVKPEAGPWAVGLYSPERRSPEPTCAGRVPSTRRAWPAEAQEPRGAAGRAGGSAQRVGPLGAAGTWLSPVDKYVEPPAPGCGAAGCQLPSGSLLPFTRS